MILKKPYAFLIKHFKNIHLALLLIIIYITVGFQKILSFFSNYNSTTNFVGEVAAGNYVPITMFIAVVIVIIFSILMYLLMKQKKKPSLFYLLSTGFYSLTFIAQIVSYNVIKKLEYGTMDERTALAYNDIFTIMFVINFYFIIASAIRSVGFDVKKFNFSKDLEELEIKSEDNEEFEFVLGNDSFKWKRKLRRAIREFKYYVIENKFFISIIAGVVVGVTAIVVLLNVTLLNRRYSIGSTLKTDAFNYTLKNVYVSSYDIAGQKIKSDKEYLILDMNITSNYTDGGFIEQAKFYVTKSGKVMNYKSSFSDSFRDIGNSYAGDKITTNGGDYIFIFEVDKNTRGSYTLKVFDQIKYDKNGNETYKFKDFDFIPQNIDYELTQAEKKLNEPITFNKSIFGSTTLTIKSVTLSNSHEYSYDSCDNNNENCIKIYDVQLPLKQNTNNLLSIEYELNIDKKSQIYRAVGDSAKNFFNRFLKVSFTSGETTFITDIETTENSKIKGYIFADVSKTIKKDKNTKLVISTRGEYYTIGF